jgi:hypothetical protein
MTWRTGVPLVVSSLGSAVFLFPRIGSICCIFLVWGWGVSPPVVLCEFVFGSLCCTLSPKYGILQPKGGMYFVYDSDDLAFCPCVFVQLCARMLPRLGGCCWFPQLYTVIGDCTKGVSYARGRVFSVHVSCPILFLQSVVA